MLNKCGDCGAEFEAANFRRVYCDTCRQPAAVARRYRERHPEQYAAKIQQYTVHNRESPYKQAERERAERLMRLGAIRAANTARQRAAMGLQ